MYTTSKWPLLCALLLAAPLTAVACEDTTQKANPPPQPTAEPSAVPTGRAHRRAGGIGGSFGVRGA